ncbi:family 16 glycosyl hydrolase [Pseudomassariella vexata]|uniref:Family 16 glycosyl hydrolase n=1 Tax=Pseudomassariella vexata TaxID=1141098 RepID=A0A1Y2DR90_9PEZI|nr:family 16 glycosyl hydrolase [Pseudomassariella vexata]ORY61709.1 family 16 glycosyl hydrolase [Pseudomassariella vexata]
MGLPKVISLLALFSSAIRAAVPSIEGFTITWSDDFTGAAGSLPDSANWLVDTGTSYPGGASNWGTGEIQTFTSNPENIQQDGNGVLKITAIKDEAGGWTSARIETQRTDFLAQPGSKMRIQASLNLPQVEQPIGYWPAFWTLGAPFRGNYLNWPSIGEFDIMENVNGIDEVFGTLHCGSNPGGPCNETTGISGKQKGCPGSICQGNFHTYTFEVDRTQTSAEFLRWYVDDVQFFELAASDVEAEAWNQTVHEPHFLLMNLAIGGSFPNKEFGADATPLEDTTSGGVYQAEYVASCCVARGKARETV